jgi:hypothetical protein
LLLGRARQEVVDVRTQGGNRRQQQEGIHGDEDRENAVTPHADEHELQWQDEKEGHRERQPVALAARSERDEFPQRKERSEGKQHERHRGAQQERRGEDGHHDPPRVDARIQVRDARGLLFVARTARQPRADS